MIELIIITLFSIVYAEKAFVTTGLIFNNQFENVMKDMKEKVFFQVNVTEKTTTINGPQDFEIYVIDQPPSQESFELDEPPKLMKEGGEIRG